MNSQFAPLGSHGGTEAPRTRQNGLKTDVSPAIHPTNESSIAKSQAKPSCQNSFCSQFPGMAARGFFSDRRYVILRPRAGGTL